MGCVCCVVRDLSHLPAAAPGYVLMLLWPRLPTTPRSEWRPGCCCCCASPSSSSTTSSSARGVIRCHFSSSSSFHLLSSQNARKSGEISSRRVGSRTHARRTILSLLCNSCRHTHTFYALVKIKSVSASIAAFSLNLLPESGTHIQVYCTCGRCPR